jgi:hypothetical protein
MTPLRRKRLILLASNSKQQHKRFYAQYLELIHHEFPSPVFWTLGTALLTEYGWEEYRKYINDSL